MFLKKRMQIQTVLLCGGKGTRLEGLDLPKPLCTILGKPLVYHVLKALPTEFRSIRILYSEALEQVQFERTVIHSCPKEREYIFQKIPLETRGPVETAYVGLQKLRKNLDTNTPILIMDNDTINQIDISDISISTLGIGTYTTEDRSKPYSFLTVTPEGIVTAIKEKEGISTTYATGLYYFPSLAVFFELCDTLFAGYPTKKEYFISDLYGLALDRGDTVRAFPCKETVPLGTRTDIIENIERVPVHPMRLCFDIDNTLVCYSEKTGTTDGIAPIQSMVALVRKLHAEGHTIVLQTARGMKTCDSNIGKAGKKSALSVLQMLEEYDIPYDEIYFGKPWADLYIDDRAWNQYTNPSFAAFMFNHNVKKTALELSKSCSNNENILFRNDSLLIKEGPASSLEGEIYFYRKIQTTPFSELCPRMFDATEGVQRSSLELEFIEGPTISKLFRNFLLTKPVLQKVYNTLTLMHSIHIENDGIVTKNDIVENYTGKLSERVKSHPNYRLPKIDEMVRSIQETIHPYLESPRFKITNVIHGDPWFDNMMYTTKQEVKLLDMKGKLGSIFSLKGDRMTDYAKLYQSILGFDFYLNGEEYPVEYEAKCKSWLEELLPFSIEDPVFEAITACCILKTFYYFFNTEPIGCIYRSLGKLKLFSKLFDRPSEITL